MNKHAIGSVLSYGRRNMDTATRQVVDMYATGRDTLEGLLEKGMDFGVRTVPRLKLNSNLKRYALMSGLFTSASLGTYYTTGESDISLVIAPVVGVISTLYTFSYGFGEEDGFEPSLSFNQDSSLNDLDL